MLNRIVFHSLILSFLMFSKPSFAQQEQTISDANTVTIYGSPLDPDRKIGTYNQPNWTTERRFGAIRSYVIPEDRVEVEVWYKPKVYKDEEGGDQQIIRAIEFEVGIANHLQFDFYYNQIKKQNEDDFEVEGYQTELRWAFADWGEILANPTIYLEYHTRVDAPDKAEIRFLFADDIAPKFHWSANVLAETELGGEEVEREYALTGGLSYNLVNSFAVGAETKVEWADVEDNRGHFGNSVYVGPSLQLRAIQGMHFNMAWLYGANDDAHKAEGIIVAGLDLM